MECEQYQAVIEKEWKSFPAADAWRHRCGCIKTSDKLKELLKVFPSPPPPTPVGRAPSNTILENKSVINSKSQNPPNCISAYCAHAHQLHSFPKKSLPLDAPNDDLDVADERNKTANVTKSWRVILELVQLVQLSVTATALALYYLIYCYMQLVYYTLRSALYFHQADGPMKITIGVVTITSLVVGFNLLLRLERLLLVF